MNIDAIKRAVTIITARYRGYTSIKIIVDGESVYRFDSFYEKLKRVFQIAYY